MTKYLAVSALMAGAVFVMVLAAGAAADFVSTASAAWRALYAAASAGALTFCLLMALEELSWLTLKRHLSSFIINAKCVMRNA